MPMVPEATWAMLACARLGVIHSVVFGGFASKELSNRIDCCEPSLIITSSVGIEPRKKLRYVPIVDQALEMSNQPDLPRLIVQRHSVYYELDLKEGCYHDYHKLMQDETEQHPCVEVESNHELYILYTSGTTGAPKGIVRDTGGTTVALNWVMDRSFNLQKGDTFFAASDIGWVVGHSFIVYGPLIRGATTIVFEGKPVGVPDPGTFWRVVEQHKPHTLYVAPTAVRIIKKEDYEGEYMKKYDTSSLKYFHVVGERCDPDTIAWIHKQFPDAQINDNWWQTETGWPICSNYFNLHRFPTVPGSCSKPCPGYDVQVLDDNNEIVEPGVLGKVSIRLPMPPSFMLTLWGNNKVFEEKYLTDSPGWYSTGDAGNKDKHGYVYIMTRLDDVINTAGHRISTGRIEEVINSHDQIVESAVFGYNDPVKGEVPFALIVPATGAEYDKAQIVKEVALLVRQDIGAFSSLHHCGIVQKLPKTRSGKILRGTIRKISNRQEFTTPATIEDASVLDTIKEVIEEELAKSK